MIARRGDSTHPVRVREVCDRPALGGSLEVLTKAEFAEQIGPWITEFLNSE